MSEDLAYNNYSKQKTQQKRHNDKIKKLKKLNHSKINQQISSLPYNKKFNHLNIVEANKGQCYKTGENPLKSNKLINKPSAKLTIKNDNKKGSKVSYQSTKFYDSEILNGQKLHQNKSKSVKCYRWMDSDLSWKYSYHHESNSDYVYDSPEEKIVRSRHLRWSPWMEKQSLDKKITESKIKAGAESSKYFGHKTLESQRKSMVVEENRKVKERSYGKSHLNSVSCDKKSSDYDVGYFNIMFPCK